MAKAKYRLWAAATDETSTAAAEKARFSRVGVAYVLIYDRHKPNLEHCVEVAENEIDALNAAEAQWLWDCNVLLISEETAKNRKQIMATIDEKLDKFEAALKRQREIEKAKGDCAETCDLTPYLETANERPMGEQ